MLRVIQCDHAGAAKGYYTRGDYYAPGEDREHGQELPGRWGGRAAERLGLAGEVTKAAFSALCDNLDPNTGKRLTARTREKRRAGYDINFHAPKSVSLLYGLTRDEAILTAFRDAVSDTMQEMEADVRTRIRKGGQQAEHISGNWAYGLYVHLTARPEGGIPDPHLHAHCFVPNAAWCTKEERWKAIDIAAIQADAPYFEAAFHARLARNLAEAGFGIERKAKAFEIAGIPEQTLKAFSRRTEAIEREAGTKGITSAKEKDRLGAKTRSRKADALSMEELRGRWMERLGPQEREAIDAVASRSVGGGKAITAEAALDHAIRHCFERDACVPERALLETALRFGTGSVTPEQVKQEAGAERHGIVHLKGERRPVTTKEVITEERAMLAIAREGRGASLPMARFDRPLSVPETLDAGQARAFKALMRSTDRVMLLKGAAGTGKTRLMREVAEAYCEQRGRDILAFAPTAEAANKVLAAEGFEASTVARLLVDPKLQERIERQTIWIDEAGMLGTKTLASVLRLAEAKRARIILSGDIRQHAPVERGSPLRLLETRAGLPVAELSSIRRQRGGYREAARALAAGRLTEGFDRLEALGFIRELPEAVRHAELAREFTESLQAGKEAIVICPTHHEGEALERAIREELKAAGRLGAEREVITLKPKHLTEAERSDPVRYEPGDVLVFHQNGRRGFRKGSRLTVTEENRDSLPLDQAERFQVFLEEKLTLAKGDRIRITAGGKSRDGHRLTSGACYELAGFTKEGHLKLANGWTIDKGYGQLAGGWVMTSHKAQGKTVDLAFVAQGRESMRATSAEQLYVSATRAREACRFYCPDAGDLRDAFARSEAKPAALDGLAEQAGERLRRYRFQLVRAFRERVRQVRETFERNRSRQAEFAR
ncbi:MobF family relaxase [Tautonia rosea]|uniref:MobF family relaxase n=1 Tax=Tautonia rosea TaxID=2728037 RepID=UPI00147391C2|nr:MobF family relaxase [Tautonia rosea]